LHPSVNTRALKLVEKLVSEADELKVQVERLPNGATLIDSGVKAKGSILAGLLVTRISAGDLLEISVTNMKYEDRVLPTLQIYSDFPVIACIGSQYGDWEIRVGEFYAIGSGPARALALNRKTPTSVAAKKKVYEKKGYTISSPREVYERIKYSDSSEEAVIILESQQLPKTDVLSYIADECGIKPANLYAIVTPTTSLVGAIQIVGRVVEVGIHKLGLLGFELTRILYGSGFAPLPPVHPNLAKAMGRVNDVIRYAGATFYGVDLDIDTQLEKIVVHVPSSASENYEKLFEEIFAESPDFHGVDLGVFSPATVTVNNVKTGSVFHSGKFNLQMLKKLFAN